MTETNNGNPSYLQGNSNADKAAAEERKVEKVVQGKVTARKQPAGKRLRESLGLEETRTVGDYLVWDVLIPAAKEMVADLVKKGIDVFLYGGTGRAPSYSRGNPNRSHVSYEGYYKKDRDRERRPEGYSRYNPRGFSDFHEFVFDDKRDAEMVLSELCEAIDVYGWAKVSDFYSLVGETERNYTAQGYGWEALGNATIERVRDGWIIDLPRPISNRR